jgi:hypothetical protein
MIHSFWAKMTENNLISQISELQHALNQESKKYHHIDNCITSGLILRCNVCLHVISHFVTQNKFKEIYFTFEKYNFNINGLLKCFKEKNDKIRVRLIYKNICQLILEKLG